MIGLRLACLVVDHQLVDQLDQVLLLPGELGLSLLGVVQLGVQIAQLGLNLRPLLLVCLFWFVIKLGVRIRLCVRVQVFSFSLRLGLRLGSYKQ